MKCGGLNGCFLSEVIFSILFRRLFKYYLFFEKMRLVAPRYADLEHPLRCNYDTFE